MNGAVESSASPSTPTSKPTPSPWDFASHFRSIFATRPTFSAASSTGFFPTLTSSSLPVLDGVRALLCLTMITYHSFEFLLPYVPAPAANELFHQPSLYLLSIGPVIVDWFFVLTGFLTALPLLQQEKRYLRQIKDQPHTTANTSTHSHDSPYHFSVTAFWYRRLTRFLPSWAFTYLVHHIVLFPVISMTRSALRNQMWEQLFSTMPAADKRVDGNIPSMCANTGFLPFQLTMLVHLLPFGGCQGVIWSLGVQCQFYLFFPLLWQYLLRCSQRGGATAGERLVRVMWYVIALWSVMRVVVFFHQLTAPLAHIEGMAVFFWWYTSTVTRIGTIAAGVVLAHLCTSSSLPSYLHARPILYYCLHATHLVLLLVMRYTSEVQGEGPGTSVLLRTQQLLPMRVKAEQHFPPSLAQLANIGHYWHYLVLNALLGVGSPGMAACICFSLLSLIHRTEAITTRLSRLLSSSILTPIAALSYMAYLIHPSVQQYYYLQYTDHIDPHWLPTLPAFLTHTALLITLTFVLSLLLYVLWDGPVMVWLGGVGRLGGEVWLRRYAWLCVGLSVLCHSVMVPGLLFGYRPIEDAVLRINNAATYNPVKGS